MEIEVTGDIVTEDGVLVIKRILTQYRLRLPEERRAEAERVHGFHARGCPVARSIEAAIEVETQLTFV